MLIVQISDCHVTEPPVLAYGRVDTVRALRQAVAAIGALPRQPDLILVSGDLAQSGREAEYDIARDELALLGSPIVPVMGNHDDREALTDAFDLKRRFKVQPGFVQYVVPNPNLRVIVLDSVTPGSAEPSFCVARFAWLADRLAEDDRPTLLAIHHPPFPAGVAWMEPRDRAWASSLEKLVASQPAVAGLVCGHVHRGASTVWAGAPARSAPSIAHQVFFDLATARRRFSFEAPAFLVHQWVDDRLVTYTVAVPGLAETFDLDPPKKGHD